MSDSFMMPGRPPKMFETERIPLVGQPTARPATAGAFPTKDQRFVNFLPIKLENPLTDKRTFWCVKRPGFARTHNHGGSNVGTALHVWETVGSGATIVSAFGGTTSTIYEDTTSRGTITGWARSFTESDTTGASRLLITSSDSTLWYLETGGAPIKITDVDYPGNASRTTVGDIITMDGYLFIMDSTGRVYNSDLNSITSWEATAYTAPTLYTGNGVGLARHHDAIVAFSTSSIEFFVNDGETPSPIRRRDMIATQVGGVLPAGKGRTMATVRDRIFFLSSARIGGSGVHMIERFAIKKASNPIIDAQIEVAEPQNCTLTACRFWGRDWLLLVAGTVSFIYNIEDDIWSEIHSDVGTLWNVTAGATTGDGRVFSLSTTTANGRIYEINTDTPVWQDDSTAYTASIQTSLIDLGTEKRKRWHSMHLIGDIQSSDCLIDISWSDSDYEAFTSARQVNMANSRAYITRCGLSRRRALKLSTSSNSPCRLEAIEFDFSKCEN